MYGSHVAQQCQREIAPMISHYYLPILLDSELSLILDNYFLIILSLFNMSFIFSLFLKSFILSRVEIISKLF